MSTLRRLATAVAATAAAVFATLALASSPAYAADAVDVSISGVSGNAAGGRTFLQVTFTNRSNTTLPVVSVITIHLDGMDPDGVVVQSTFGSQLPGSSAGDGSVRFTDTPFDLGKGTKRALSYLVQFSPSAPSGKASITVEAYNSQSGLRLGGNSVSTTVRGFGSSTKPSGTSSTPPNTNPGIVPTFEAGPSFSVAPLPQPGELVNADVPVSLYVLGALLMLLGGVILFLLFRHHRPAGRELVYASSEPQETRAPSLGYPNTSLHPTSVLPSVRDAEPPDPRTRRPHP